MNLVAPTEQVKAALRSEIENLKPISSDSHVTEPPTMYVDYIDPKFRGSAPHVITQDGGEFYSIPGVLMVPMGLVASAGRRPEDLGHKFNPCVRNEALCGRGEMNR